MLTALWRCFDVGWQSLRLMGSASVSDRKMYCGVMFWVYSCMYWLVVYLECDYVTYTIHSLTLRNV